MLTCFSPVGVLRAEFLSRKTTELLKEVRWLSGQVLIHCVGSLSKIHFPLLGTGSTQEDPCRHNTNIVQWGVKNQMK